MNKSAVAAVIFVIVLAGLGGYFYYKVIINSGANTSVSPQIETVHGMTTEVSLSAAVIVLQTDDNRILNLNISPDTKIFDDNNNGVSLNFFQKGFTVQATGSVDPNDPNKITLSELHAATVPNIFVISPQPNDTVGDTLTVTGKARVFESQFALRISVNGEKLYETNVMATAPDVGQFGDFSKQIALNQIIPLNATSVVLEALDYSAKNGSETDKVSIPLNYQSGNVKTIKVFFNNSQMDPQVSCNKVFPVNRTIQSTPALGAASIRELLKGPTDDEKSQGFGTSINSGVVAQKLVIENGVANVDFNERLEAGVGGSCKVSAIRSQITQTLKQFPGVQSVVISINGNSTSTLQP